MDDKIRMSPWVAATGRHVDDFCIRRKKKKGNEVWETAKNKLQDHYRWKMWEYDNFPSMWAVRGGTPERWKFSLDELRENTDYKSTKKKKKDKLIDTTRTNRTEKTPGWFWAGNVNRQVPQYSAATGLQRSRIEQATVQDMMENQ